MPAQNAEGIILRKYYLRETSFILVVFTKEFGKIKGVIKGVRNPYPQFAGDFEMFTRCGLTFYKKRKSSLDLITQCDAMEPFLEIRKDIEKLTYANYFVELVDIVSEDHNANAALFDVLSGSLKMIASGVSPKRTGRIFELKVLEALGLSPQVGSCVGCGEQLEKKVFFDVKSGGALCGTCGGRARGALQVSLGTVKFMQKIQKSDIERTALIKVSKEVGEETENVLRRFLGYYINRPIRSLKFLNNLYAKGIA